jgi:hypothetical protein
VRSAYVWLVVLLNLVLFQASEVSSASGPAGAAPIGTILQATRSTGEIDTKYEGATIFDGDTLTTSDVSVLRIQFGGPQMLMRPNSVTEVHGISGFSAKLIAGTIVISAKGGRRFQVIADGTTIQPLGESMTTAQITLLSPTELLVTSQRGSLAVSLGSEVKTVEPGNSYRVEIHSDPEPNSPEPQSRPLAPGKSHFNMIPVVAVPIVTGIIAWRALVSPPKP